MVTPSSIFTRFINVGHIFYILASSFNTFSLLLTNKFEIELKEFFDNSKTSWRASFGLIAPLVVMVNVSSSSAFNWRIISVKDNNFLFISKIVFFLFILLVIASTFLKI